MAFIAVIGAQLAVAKTYGASIAMSALTNAAEAVGTLAAAHGLLVGDVVEITSGWGGCNLELRRIKTVNVNDVTFEGLDTQNLVEFPAGSGAGSVRKISAWTTVSQIENNMQTSGGEQQVENLSLMAQRQQIAIPTNVTAINQTVPVFYSPNLAGLADARLARNAVAPYGVRVTYGSSMVSYGNAYWSFVEAPRHRNGAVAIDISLQHVARVVNY